MQQVKLLFVDRIHPQSNKFATGVESKGRSGYVQARYRQLKDTPGSALDSKRELKK